MGPAWRWASGLVAVMARITRSSVLEVLERGLRPDGPRQGAGRAADRRPARPEERAAADRHLSGLALGGLLGGSVAVERAFGVPGLGHALVQALDRARLDDDPEPRAPLRLIFTVINLLVDLSYGLIDPRIRYQ